MAIYVAPGTREDDYAELQLTALENVWTEATAFRTQFS
jgi:hypothetical protein